jgi:hypothetical protein
MSQKSRDAMERPRVLMSRREILRQAAVLGGGMALLGAPLSRTFAQTAAGARPYSGVSYAFELDGKFAGMLKGASGGFARADVVSEKADLSGLSKKHIALTAYDDLTISCSPVMPKELVSWIASVLGGKGGTLRKSGAILTLDNELKERTRQEFNNALIREIAFPACEAGGKQADALTITLAPEFTRPLGGSGTLVPGGGGTKQASVWTGNFRLNIQGLEPACARITRIEPFTFRQTVAEKAIGELRDYAKVATALEFPNLVFSIPEAFAGPFYAWFDDMVVKGNAGEDRERPGILELMRSDLTAALLTLNLSHVGIFRYAPQAGPQAGDKVGTVEVGLYCEQMTLGPTVTT